MYKKINLSLSIFINLILISNLYAEKSSRVEILSSKNLKNIENLFISDHNSIIQSSSGVKSRYLENPIKVRVKVRGLGRLESNLRKQRYYNIDSKDSAFLQGEVANLSQADTSDHHSFATISNKQNGDKLLRLFLVGHSRGNNDTSWKGIAEVRTTLIKEKDSYKVGRTTLHRSKKGSADKLGCPGGHNPSGTHSHQIKEGASIKAEVKIAKILLEADSEYVNQISNSMRVELATIINGVDTIYQRDLGLSFEATIADRPTEYSSSIAYNENYEILLHNEMKALQPANSRGSDIHYLFTGKTPVGQDLANLAGVVPQLGAVCKNPENSIGLTIRIDTATDIVVTAHEVGHLYGGEHDDAYTDPNDPNIMSSVVGGTITSFSSFSISQIGSYVSENGSCLVIGTGTGGGGEGGGGTITLPSTGTLYAFKRGRNFAVELYDSETDEVYEGYTVNILYSKKSKGSYVMIKEVITDDEGIAFFRPKKKGYYMFEIEEKRSKKLRLK